MKTQIEDPGDLNTIEWLAHLVDDLPADASAALIVDAVLAGLQAPYVGRRLEKLTFDGPDFHDAIEAIRQRFV